MAKVTVFKPVGTTSKQITPFPEIKVAFPKTFVSPQVTKSAGGADPTLYTVPAGKIFVLYSAYISQIAINATGGGELQLRSSDPNCQILLCNITVGSPAAGEKFTENLTQQFEGGIRFASGTTFSLFRASGQEAQCGMHGYLVDNNAESLFYLTA